MLYLISPAKTLDYDTPVPAVVLKKASDPLFTERALSLIEVMKKKSAQQVAALMDLSPTLAQLNVERYANWQAQATPHNSKPALLAFNGDVYDGLQARSLKAADLAWAQTHVLILSGLYGVLRPLDRLQPYRLEMGTALKTPQGKNLYDFWGAQIAEHINAVQADEVMPTVINLASIEYARAALHPTLRARVVHCVFEESKDGEHKVVSFFAKKARGLMLRHAITHKARSVKALDSFNAEGYALDVAASTPQRRVFRRPYQTIADRHHTQSHDQSHDTAQAAAASK
jgi:uncharacterized protein